MAHQIVFHGRFHFMIALFFSFGFVGSANAQTALPIEGQPHYLGVRLLNLNGLEFTYSHRLNDQMLIGASISQLNQSVGNRRDGQGDLVTGQYYAHDADVSRFSEEINFTYLFREEGYKEFGFLVRTSLGQAHGKAVGKFYRYDQDPGVFQLGDGKRLQETGPNTETTFSTMYARLGVHYQCVWKRKTDSSIGAHILEFGTSSYLYKENPVLPILQSNGVTKMFDVELPKLTLEVAYMMVF